MNLNPVDIASYIAAGALAASKLFSVAQPLWNKLPKWLAVAVPVLVLDLPVVASYFGAPVHSAGDLVAAGVTSLALLLPGLAQAEQSK